MMNTSDLALDHYDRNAIDGIFNVACDYYDAGQLDEALSVLQVLSVLAPEDEGVWNALAQCHDDLGQPDVAEHLRLIPERMAASCSV